MYLDIYRGCRSPHGERGLKYFCWYHTATACRSLPTRGAWIEIFCHICYRMVTNSRSPHGERGLKYSNSENHHKQAGGRSPHGERGLKFEFNPLYDVDVQRSLPTRGAWIEIRRITELVQFQPRRSPHGERGLKYRTPSENGKVLLSLPTRGAWIEIVCGRPQQ